jgi:hypothetical protein
LTRICCLTIAVVFLTGSGQAGDRETAQEALERIQEAAARPTHDGFRELFTKDAFGRVTGDEAEPRRLALAKTLQASVITNVRRKGDEAVATLKTKTDIKNRVEREVFLRREGGRWRIASGGTYIAAKHTKPAKVRLTMRTRNESYGASAFSFAYVTGDPALCKNRVDIWFCHNKDFHVCYNRIARLGKVSLKSVKRVPLGLDWGSVVAVRKGHTYVVHCRDPRDRDFFVKLKVTKMKRGIVQLEWALLTGGFGAPKTIHEARPLRSNDAADACEGLCGKHG